MSQHSDIQTLDLSGQVLFTTDTLLELSRFQHPLEEDNTTPLSDVVGISCFFSSNDFVKITSSQLTDCGNLLSNSIKTFSQETWFSKYMMRFQFRSMTAASLPHMFLFLNYYHIGNDKL